MAHLIIVIALAVLTCVQRYRRWSRRIERIKRERRQRITRERLAVELETLPGATYWLMVSFSRMNDALRRTTDSFKRFKEALERGELTDGSST